MEGRLEVSQGLVGEGWNGRGRGKESIMGKAVYSTSLPVEISLDTVSHYGDGSHRRLLIGVLLLPCPSAPATSSTRIPRRHPLPARIGIGAPLCRSRHPRVAPCSPRALPLSPLLSHPAGPPILSVRLCCSNRRGVEIEKFVVDALPLEAQRLILSPSELFKK